ncbi:MAG: phenylalanine--tRNA ligase beta subunit-related protein [Candidatus Bathyarchaeia archaeon]
MELGKTLEQLFVWDKEVVSRFPELSLGIGIVREVKVEKTNRKIEELRKQVFEEVRRLYKTEVLKDNPTVRAYRDLYWSLGIDPTKTRPSGEALLRRVLRGDEIPNISNVVDAYNLASLKTIIPMSGFDLDAITPPLHIRFSKENDVFQGIGAQAPTKLENKVLVLSDKTGIVCIYPYRDADATKIMDKTRNILLIGYGAPKITPNRLLEAVELALTYVNEVSGGKIERKEVFSSTF